jgi:hypothetical protein
MTAPSSSSRATATTTTTNTAAMGEQHTRELIARTSPPSPPRPPVQFLSQEVVEVFFE